MPSWAYLRARRGAFLGDTRSHMHRPGRTDHRPAQAANLLFLEPVHALLHGGVLFNHSSLLPKCVGREGVNSQALLLQGPRHRTGSWPLGRKTSRNKPVMRWRFERPRNDNDATLQRKPRCALSTLAGRRGIACHGELPRLAGLWWVDRIAAVQSNSSRPLFAISSAHQATKYSCRGLDTLFTASNWH